MATKTLVTKFAHAEEAESAARKLREDGFADVGWVTHELDGHETAHGSLVRKQRGSRNEHAMIGAFLGWLAGLLASVTVANTMGLTGPLRIALPLVAASLCALLGAAIAKQIDALVRTEEPVDRAHHYANHLERDAAVVTVRVDGEETEARALQILRGEADLHRHDLVFRIPSMSDERPSLG